MKKIILALLLTASGLIYVGIKKIISPELIVVIITSLTTIFGLFYAQYVKELEITRRNKIETYEKYGESIVKYLFIEDIGNETYINYQISRFKFALWASDETAKTLLEIAPKDKYKSDDPVSKIIYALRKDVNPGSKISREQMAGIDPAQWTATLGRS